MAVGGTELPASGYGYGNPSPYNRPRGAMCMMANNDVGHANGLLSATPVDLVGSKFHAIGVGDNILGYVDAVMRPVKESPGDVERPVIATWDPKLSRKQSVHVRLRANMILCPGQHPTVIGQIEKRLA